MSTEPEIITFGCRLNAYESEVMRDHARAAGQPDTVIINTCAVTKEAERQARQTIRKLRRERPGAKIIVTGCAAQIDPQSFGKMPEVDQVIGNAEKLKAESYLTPSPERIHVTDIMELRETAEHLIGGFEGRTRAFIQIQQGCDHRCTFCIIPFGRGPSRSVPLGRIVDQIRLLVQGGTREIVLTGVDLTSYGHDLPGQPQLGQIVRRLLAQLPELPRLRLSSLDPVELDDELISLYGSEPRLLPHVHLSVQAGDDMILKRMKRRHLRPDVLTIVNRLRAVRPDIAIGADIIAGFPTEDDAMFANTLALVSEAGLSHLHVFPYSSRPGTPAARMPQLQGPVIRDRAARLRAAGETEMARFLARQVGTTAEVLIERPGFGQSGHYLPVTVPETLGAVGDIVTVTITAVDGDRLTGKGCAQ